MNAEPPRLFCFGLGYSALVLAGALIGRGWTVAGTCRETESLDELNAAGIKMFPFDGERAMEGAALALEGASHVLSSVPPGAAGDPVLRHHKSDIAAIGGLKWVGYLSTTGVYGDTGGRMVDETSPLEPTSERSRWRVEAEKEWLALPGAPAHIFRLSGIYGPGSSVLDRVRDGTARLIDKPGHLFSRIHVDDIANVVMASMDRPGPGPGGNVYNVCDDEPAEASEVTLFACGLLGIEPPQPVSFDEASKGMSAMALTFWRDNRLIDNSRIKNDLGVELIYPNYRFGLEAVLAAERNGTA